jgi:hypothetical protein
MNREELIVFEHLIKLHGKGVLPVLAHNDPPDIVIDSSIGIEVTRLNQHFFESEKPEGLESLSFPLEDALEEVLNSFNHLYAGKSYWVCIDFKRPLNSSIHQVKKDMKLALNNLLASKTIKFPYQVTVNSEIAFSIYESSPGNGKLFPRGGTDDFNAMGQNISTYATNIHYCINKKSSIIQKKLDRYSNWWLYLVDCIGFGLSQEEILEVAKGIGDLGNFDKIVVLSYDGQDILLTISK